MVTCDRMSLHVISKMAVSHGYSFSLTTLSVFLVGAELCISVIDSVCEVGPQARPSLNRAWARPASHTVDVVTVTLPVATVTVVGATTNRVLCPTLTAEEAQRKLRCKH